MVDSDTELKERVELGEGYSVLPLKLAIERPNDVCVSPEKARPSGHLLGCEFAPSHKVTVRRTSGARRIVHQQRVLLGELKLLVNAGAFIAVTSREASDV
jgi:hypothetical protein